MSNERATKPAPIAEKKQGVEPSRRSDMTSEQAATMVLAPYVTEKTFNQIEKENKLAFIVTEKATKKQIIEAINILYEADIEEVNTTRTIRGKKAFVKFKTAEGARDLATKLALV
ncbi:MAG TPA: 50S ribosomal protein L23 [Nitrososphaera sp.]